METWFELFIWVLWVLLIILLEVKWEKWKFEVNNWRRKREWCDYWYDEKIFLWNWIERPIWKIFLFEIDMILWPILFHGLSSEYIYTARNINAFEFSCAGCVWISIHSSWNESEEESMSVSEHYWMYLSHRWCISWIVWTFHSLLHQPWREHLWHLLWRIWCVQTCVVIHLE